MKSVSIIGAASYLARNLTAMLRAEEGVRLYLYDLPKTHPDGYNEYVSLDPTTEEGMARVRLDVDAIYLFTGKTGTMAGFDEPLSYLDVNERTLLLLLLEYRRQHSTGRLVFPSTRLLYQDASFASETQTSDALRTVYAINKQACEQYLAAWSRMFGLRYTVFRICIPYGTMVPGASSYGTAEFMLKRARAGVSITLFGGGKVRRTLTYIGDLCRILIDGADSEACENQVFNVGGEDKSLFEMASLIAEKWHVDVGTVPYPQEAALIESGDTVFDSRKLDAALSPRYEMTFQEWLKSLQVDA